MTSAVRARLRRLAETVYYAAPRRLRDAIQVASYRMLDRRIEALGARASEYPVDATGWLVIELVKTLIGRAAGSLLRIARWPAGYRSAALLTHDLEPQPYAYSEGLDRLLQRVADLKVPSAFGVVATPGDRYLRAAQRGALAAHDVFSHGLDHRGEQVWGRDGVVSTVRAARATVERVLERSVYGYRSPRLDRSPDLDWALDHAGFTYDSSHPDVDRENMQHYGRGVRLNLPYRPLLEDGDGHWRLSRCLELPLTAPDCIQPLFAGQDGATLRATIEEKAAFVRGSGGLYVALVHAGVFGPDDAARREAHLDVVVEQLRQGDTWLTSPQLLVEWWCAREQLRVTNAGSAVRVYNRGPRPVEGAVAVSRTRRVDARHRVAFAGARGRRERSGRRGQPHSDKRVERMQIKRCSDRRRHRRARQRLFPLTQQGLRPVVLEASDRLGGLATHFEHERRDARSLVPRHARFRCRPVRPARRARAQRALIVAQDRHGLLSRRPACTGSTRRSTVLRFRALPLVDRLRTGLGALVHHPRRSATVSPSTTCRCDWLRRIFGARVFEQASGARCCAPSSASASTTVPAYWVWNTLNAGKERQPGSERLSARRLRAARQALRDAIVRGGGEVRLQSPDRRHRRRSGAGVWIESGAARMDYFTRPFRPCPCRCSPRSRAAPLGAQVPLPELAIRASSTPSSCRAAGSRTSTGRSSSTRASRFKASSRRRTSSPPEWVGGRHLIYVMNYCDAEL